MDILDDMGVSKLSAKVVSKVNYSIKLKTFFHRSWLCSTSFEHFSTELLLLQWTLGCSPR